MLNKRKCFFCFTLFVALGIVKAQEMAERVVKYELRVQNATKNVTGVEVTHALAINGSIPAPTLRFRLGDLAVITVINETDEPTTLHWHGVLVPWRQDGPQFTNTKIIEPHTRHVFEFPIRHTGTYWYHSHTELQEQRGLYGAIVIEDDLTPNVDHDVVVVMSDWTNERPSEVLANLKRDGHYYKYKKGSPPSLLDAIDRGELRDYLKNEWNRMEPMDLSDVGYDAFLINGEQTSVLNNVGHGEKIRFRLINAAASTYFYFNIGHLRNFTVISKDGMPVKPVVVNELLMGMGETYDIIFQVPHAMKTFEARAIAQDITGSASLLFGGGDIEEVPEKLAPSPYTMESHQGHGPGGLRGPVGGGHGGHAEHSGHESHNMAGVETKRLTYPMLESITPSEFDQNLIRAKVIDLELSGDMERYTWYINGKPFSEDKYIEIRENEVITFRFINTTMMHHPMHLHGHFFRLLAGQGKSAPLFHTVDVAPTSTVTIEFHANEPGIWFLHCHNLYHMKMGMARLVKYQNVERPPELVEDEQKWGEQMVSDNSPFWNREIDLYSNFAKAELVRNSGRTQAVIEIEIEEYDFNDFSRNLDNLELEAIWRKYVDDLLALGGGVVYKHQRAYAALAAVYNLPGNTELEGYVRHDGKVKIKFIKEIPISERFELRLEPKLKSVEDTELEDHARLHPGHHHGHNHGPQPFMDWSLKTEFYYNYNEKLSIGTNYVRGNNQQNSAGIGFKIQF